MPSSFWQLQRLHHTRAPRPAYIRAHGRADPRSLWRTKCLTDLLTDGRAHIGAQIRTHSCAHPRTHSYANHRPAAATSLVAVFGFQPRELQGYHDTNDDGSDEQHGV